MIRKYDQFDIYIIVLTVTSMSLNISRHLQRRVQDQNSGRTWL